ncbi:hypothetical protein J6T21_01430, partial [Candidatus Saccharibacteria bacterium]|nr:hypothetical protein [Candidatus Saccharibacteria bacterium]
MAISVTKASLKKLNKLAEGGEAIIYSYNNNTVLKIFKDPNVLPAKEQKIRAMLGKKSNLAVLPIDIVETNGKFIGYQMPMIDCGEPLHSFTKARFIKDNGFTNLDALQIVTQLAHAIENVHKAGFVIGDVSDNNFMASLEKGHQISLIDTDSWGINGLRPDAYTETFTPPEAYKKGGGLTLTQETDNFGFAVLAFNVLTRIHPYGGNYKQSPNMNTVERMKKRISLLGKHDIVYNDTLFNWSWMNPKLLESLEKTFEGDERGVITSELDEQLAHSKLCKIHKLYYYDRFTDCPLCSGVAKLKAVAKVVIQTTATGPKVTLIFSSDDVHMMLNAKAYFDTEGNVVDITTKKKYQRIEKAKVYLTPNGRYLVSVLKSRIIIQKENEVIADIAKMSNSSFAIDGAHFLYVDNGDILHEMLISEAGLLEKPLFQTSNPLLETSPDGHFVVNRYVDRIMISYTNHDIEITETPKIKEYAIKYDQITKTWLFIYEEANGSFRTMIFGEKGKQYDDNIVRYTATPLSNILYRKGTVYDPGNKEIVGTNLEKGASKVFQCDVVDETSMLSFDEGIII